MWEQENILDLECMCSEKLYVNLETVLMELNNDIAIMCWVPR